LPSARDTFTTGISNMCAPVAKVPSFIVTRTRSLSGCQRISAIHAPFIGYARTPAFFPAAPAIARPRGAMMPVRSLVEMNEIFLPSGENCGDTFMPGRSMIGLTAPLSAATAKIFV